MKTSAGQPVAARTPVALSNRSIDHEVVDYHMNGFELEQIDDADVVAGDMQPTQVGVPLEQIQHTRSRLVLLTATASVGGFLFGFDTGVISGALPYLRDDILLKYASTPASSAFLQELIVTAAVLAAGVSSLIGGFISDRVGRKAALAIADGLFSLGSIIMAFSWNSFQVVFGRFLVGGGIGLASVTSPIFIAECSPSEIRGQLVTYNVLAITSGQFVAYLSNFLLSFLPGTWRWMLGIAAIPAVVQYLLLMKLPESPRWMASKGRMREAEEAAKTLGISTEMYETAGCDEYAISSGRNQFIGIWQQLSEIPKQLHLGIGVQVLQQLCGINTLMYYLPVILQAAGIRSNRAALLVSLFPAGVNAAGTVVGIRTIEKYGRRKLLLASLLGVVVSLLLLGFAFSATDKHSPAVLQEESTCKASGIDRCSQCIREGCGYCSFSNTNATSETNVGVCLSPANQTLCIASDSTWYIETSCPSRTTDIIFVLVSLILYLVAFSPGLGPVPWAITSEVFPNNIRATAAGICAAANWMANAIVAQSFLTLVYLFGQGAVFWLYSAIAMLGMLWTFKFLVETKGLTLDEIQLCFN